MLRVNTFFFLDYSQSSIKIIHFPKSYRNAFDAHSLFDEVNQPIRAV